MASIPEAIYCSAPQIRYVPVDLQSARIDGIPGMTDHPSFIARQSNEVTRFLRSLSNDVVCRCTHEGPPKAAQRKRSMSTPEQGTVYAVSAGAGLPDMPALTVPGPQAQSEEPGASCIPGPVSPPRYV